jgi:tetratricopeptide (TPR) repeat protein
VSCQRVSTDDLGERFLLGRLDQAEHEAVERHLFDCDECFAQLETLRAVQKRLERDREGAPGLALRPRPAMRWWWWALASAAMVTIVVAALIMWAAVSTLPRIAELSAELAELARIEPPYYEAIRLRGVYDQAQQTFRTAMESYAAGDYAAAAPGLEEAADLDPSSPNISFFLGACYLLTERIPEGITELEHTVSLGDTPFLEESHLLLAKAHLQRGDLESARPHLNATIALEGDLAAEARSLLEQLSPGG